MIDKMREDFEAWVLRRAADTPAGVYPQLLDRYEDDPKDYRQSWVYSAWEGWQASRAALEIELPPIWVESPNTALGQACAQIRTADIQAIEAAGVRVANQ